MIDVGKELNSRVVITLIVITVTTLVLFRVGLLDQSYFIYRLNDQPHAEAYSDDVSTAKVEIVDDGIFYRCQIAPGDGLRYCVFSLELTDDQRYGIDFSSYDSIYLDVEYKTPTAKNKLRIFLRNFNPRYASPDVLDSMKFNSVQIFPEQLNTPITVPLSQFQVASWWMDKFAVRVEDSLVELDNIASLQLSTESQPDIGEYSLLVRSISFNRKIFSELSLIKGLGVLWFLVAMFLLNRQRRIFEKLSNLDPLTKMLNRRGMNQWLKNMASKKYSRQVTMYYIDIDDFKKINDQYGHKYGDMLLVEFCQRVQSLVRPQMLNDRATALAHWFNAKRQWLSRLGKPEYRGLQGPVSCVFSRLSGDEFALIFINLTETAYQALGLRLLDGIKTPYRLDNREIKIGASIGIADSPAKDLCIDELMHRADVAMYAAKRQGKNQCQVFDSILSQQLATQKNIACAVRQSLQENLFYLEFMPIYDCRTRGIRSVEILIRSHLDELKVMGPDKFIPVAEQFGLIEDIDLWVLEASLKKIRPYVSVAMHDGFKFCINISATELHNRKFVEQITSLLAQYQVPGALLDLEITETSMVDSDEQSVSLLNQLRELGISIALDDYGTGYTGYNQLLSYPVSRIKIDRCFVSGVGGGGGDDEPIQNKTMVDAILKIARSYGFMVVAEGVESEQQLEYLRNRGCDFTQGYFLGKPVSWQQFIGLSGLLKVDELVHY